MIWAIAFGWVVRTAFALALLEPTREPKGVPDDRLLPRRLPTLALLNGEPIRHQLVEVSVTDLFVTQARGLHDLLGFFRQMRALKLLKMWTWFPLMELHNKLPEEEDACPPAYCITRFGIVGYQLSSANISRRGR